MLQLANHARGAAFLFWPPMRQVAAPGDHYFEKQLRYGGSVNLHVALVDVAERAVDCRVSGAHRGGTAGV